MTEMGKPDGDESATSGVLSPATGGTRGAGRLGRRRRGVGAGLTPVVLALAIPVVILAGAGASAGIRHMFAPRPAYGAPPATLDPLMVWDGARRQAIMVTGTGGRPSSEPATWSWDGSGWIEHPSGVQPQVGTRFVGAAAYDPTTRSVVDVVSDVVDPFAPADVWTWAASAWQPMLTDGKPLQVQGGAIDYDDAHGELILVGHEPHGPGSLTTWILRGSQWKAVANGPDVPGPLHLAYDHTSHRLLLFPTAFAPQPATSCVRPAAEATQPTISGDCFLIRPQECLGCPVRPLAWDGSSWTATGMTARDGTVVADPTGDGLLDLVDDSGTARGVWRWDGRRWTRLAGLPVPPALYGWRVAPDPEAHQLVLFGGAETNGGWNAVEKTSDQTWTFDGENWALRSGRSLPKLPPAATPPPPPPCTSRPAVLHAERNGAGDVFISVQIPIGGTPGSCRSVPATLRLEKSTGTLLVVQENPVSLTSETAPGYGYSFASVTWSNWCGQRVGIVARLVGVGFDITLPIDVPPPCRSGRSASTLRVVRPIAMP
jgi:hypothetical protein